MVKKIIPENMRLKTKEKLYLKTKKDLEFASSDIVILQWHIISKANELAKEIYGEKFSLSKLSKDMDMSVSTIKKLLKFDNLTKEQWEDLRLRKIFAHKLVKEL